MDYKKKTIILATVALLLSVLYIFYNLTVNINYILPRRIIKIVTIVLTSRAISFLTVIFMKITNNRILTPSIMGLDSLYMLTQTFIIYIFSSKTLVLMSSHVNYLLSICV